MSLSTRKSLVTLARKYNALIITDDVYDFLQWPTSSTSPSAFTTALLPRLIDIDRTLSLIPGPDSFGNAVSNGSFSKIVGPGVRTGWAAGTPKFTYGLSQCGASKSGGAPSQFCATMMDAMLTSGDLSSHIELLKTTYQRRWEILMHAIRTHLLPLGVRAKEKTLQGEEVFGGYFVWVELPRNVNAEVVSARAKEMENLIVAPGRIFEVRGDESIKFENSLRFSFAWEAEENLEEGIERLKKVIEHVQEGKSASGEVKVNDSDFGEFK
jgi:DNA-binding transcriptional MocR family regulator